MRTSFNEVLKDLKLDAILMTDTSNIYYFGGYDSDTGWLLVGQENWLLTDARYILHAKESVGQDVRVCEVSAEKSYQDWVEDYIQRFGIKKLGFENLQISYAKYQTLTKLPLEDLVPIEDGLEVLRAVKETIEIEYIAKAQSIADEALKRVLPTLEAGISELEVAARIEYQLKVLGASGTSFDTIAVSGANSAKPHGVPGTKVLEQGDFLTMDFGCKYMGYCSDMTRTIIIGTASDKQREIYHTVLEAQLKGLEAIKAGVVTEDVDTVARDVISNAGYGAYFGHSLGHSLGLKIHENPRFAQGSQVVLKENMIMTVEPGIYVPNLGGVRIEDLVVVTKDGCRNLTNSPKELFETSK